MGRIVLLAAVIRLIGVDWDQRQHLHPNERFLTTVETGIQWPSANGLRDGLQRGRIDAEPTECRLLLSSRVRYHELYSAASVNSSCPVSDVRSAKRAMLRITSSGDLTQKQRSTLRRWTPNWSCCLA